MTDSPDWLPFAVLSAQSALVNFGPLGVVAHASGGSSEIIAAVAGKHIRIMRLNITHEAGDANLSGYLVSNTQFGLHFGLRPGEHVDPFYGPPQDWPTGEHVMVGWVGQFMVVTLRISGAYILI